MAAGPLTEPAELDWPALTRRYGNRREFIARLLAATAREQAETPRRLRAAAASGALAELGALAHALKGVAGNIEAKEILELAKRLDDAVRGHTEPASPLADELATRLDALLGRLAAGMPAAPAVVMEFKRRSL
jgi:hypothetical protein